MPVLRLLLGNAHTIALSIALPLRLPTVFCIVISIVFSALSATPTIARTNGLSIALRTALALLED
eukprot:8456593-Lingulodinium_polyedra.AAC.1